MPLTTHANLLLRIREHFQMNELCFEPEERNAGQKVPATKPVIQRRVKRPRAKAHTFEGEVISQRWLRDRQVRRACARATEVAIDHPAAFVVRLAQVLGYYTRCNAKNEDH